MTKIEFHYKLISLQESLRRFASSLTADRDDAQDLFQETILNSLNFYDKINDEINFKAWTYTIMKNIFINNYRRSARYNIYRDQIKELSYINQTEASGSYDPDSIYLAKEITQSIEQLKDVFQIPLKMHIEGYKYQEIADKLNLNLGTVKSRIFLSRRQLRDQLNR